MWVLIVVNLTVGTMTSVSGYSSLGTCGKAGNEIIADFRKIDRDLRVNWSCTQVK